MTSFFFQHFEIHCPLDSWFLTINQLLIIKGSLVSISISTSLFPSFKHSLSIAFDNLIMLYLGVDLYVYPIWILSDSWMYNDFHYIWEDFSYYFSKYSFCHFISSHSRNLVMHMFVHLIVSQRCLSLCSIFSILFFFLLHNMMISVVLYSSLLIVFSAYLNRLLTSQVNSLFQLLFWNSMISIFKTILFIGIF